MSTDPRTYRIERTITIDPFDGERHVTKVVTNESPGQRKGPAELAVVYDFCNKFRSEELLRGDIQVTWNVYEIVDDVERELTHSEIDQIVVAELAKKR